jgi:hypothetical protein
MFVRARLPYAQLTPERREALSNLLNELTADDVADFYQELSDYDPKAKTPFCLPHVISSLEESLAHVADNHFNLPLDDAVRAIGCEACAGAIESWDTEDYLNVDLYGMLDRAQGRSDCYDAISDLANVDAVVNQLAAWSMSDKKVRELAEDAGSEILVD